MINADTLYYTLSTIPQVLAALLALIGVFIVFKTEALHKRILGHGQRILDELDSLKNEVGWLKSIYKKAFDGEKGRRRASRILGAIRTDNEKYLIEQIQEIADIETKMVEKGERDSIPKKGFNKQVERMQKVRDQKKSLVDKTKKLFIVSIPTILLSIASLVFTELYSDKFCVSIYILAINFIAASLIILFMGYIMYKSIEDTE